MFAFVLVACGPPPVVDSGLGDGVFVDNETAYDLDYVTIVDGTTYSLEAPNDGGRGLLISTTELGANSLIAPSSCTKGRCRCPFAERR